MYVSLGTQSYALEKCTYATYNFYLGLTQKCMIKRNATML